MEYISIIALNITAVDIAHISGSTYDEFIDVHFTQRYFFYPVSTSEMTVVQENSISQTRIVFIPTTFYQLDPQ